MNGTGDGAPALGSAFPHDGHPHVRAAAVTPGLAVRAHGAVPDGTAASTFRRCGHEAILAIMSVNNGSAEIREWLRSRGESPSRRGALSRRHMELWYEAYPDQRPAGDVRLLPGPGLDDEGIDEYEDLGMLVPDGPESDSEASGGGGVGGGAPGPRTPPAADDPPRHGTKEWRRGSGPHARALTGKRPVRVTASVRGDIDAKIRFALTVPGAIWQARDPVCGGTFIDQRDDIAEALTDIVCDSADLVAFFAGPGGNFMKALKLGAALMPVIQMVAAHHVYHTIEGEQPGDAQQPDYGSYAA